MEKQEQSIKLQLLQSLLDHLDNWGGDSLESKFKPKMSVEVAAPDKEGLAEGLDHAKDIAQSPELDSLSSDSDQGGEDSDEQRMLELLGKDDDDQDKPSLGDFFSR